MKTLIKWFVKRYAKSEKIKEAVHEANAALAKREFGERASGVMKYTDDVTALANVYVKAFANDGKMDEAELAACNAKCDEVVDKYLSDERIDAIVEALFK